MKSYKNFKQYLNEGGGEEAGKMEIVKTSLEDARAFAIKEFEKYGRDLYTEIPNFDENYLRAQKAAGLGKTKRKDMPVINDEDVDELETRLKKGYIDINKPFDQTTNYKDPFPQGLSGKEAQHWLEKGLPTYDGEKKDDVVKVTIEKVKVGDLKPIQKQIYFDKSIKATAQFGAKGTTDFLKSTNFIGSSDQRIIDGHHRWLSGLLINPEMKVKVVTLHLPIKKLLPVTLAYGDAIGNSRNQ
jgi:hypothetical protein